MRASHARRRLRDHGARSPYLPADRRKKRQWLYGYGHAVIGPQYYALADVLVAPSLLEAFGLPAVEAAAAVPVVASATGGLLDTVVPGQTGLLVPPGDAAALARAIEVVVADRGRAVALGRAGRERAATSFTWDGIADTLAGYYESLLGRPTRSRVEIPVSLAAAAPAAS